MTITTGTTGQHSRTIGSRNNMANARLVLALLGCVAVVHGLAMGQLSRTGIAPGATANYRFAELNEFPITITLLGAVRSPGRYEVSRKIDLVNLFALAGGWLENADLSDIHISRLKVLDVESDRFDIKLALEDPAELSQTAVQLQEGDCVYIGTESGMDLPLVLSIVSATATLATAVFYLTRLDR